ncbi:hypothetical protein LEN26_002245 [Aphanomyces euteiches]|nr:hypothetical protein AeMF1_005957 [Aphanomyces euteiches]KAH9159628.1 hypothetical protein LEN26_002245 [Aphanomyces euteiches]
MMMPFTVYKLSAAQTKMNPINLDVENAKSAPMQTASHENLPYAIAITRTPAIARMTESHWSSVLFEHDDSEDDAKDGVDEAAEARFNDVVVGDAPQEKAPHATDGQGRQQVPLG